MELDEIIYLLKSYTYPSNDISNGEIGEQDDAAPPPSDSGGGGGAYPTVTKWETGLTRSNANQIDSKVTWKSLNKLARGKANTLL
jgi:hypothetical protein